MVRKMCLYAIVSFLLISCFKNEYGMRRFKSNRFTIKPNNNEGFTKIIDTSVFYQAVMSEDFILEYNLQDYHNGFKFYNNGRVGFFKGIHFTDEKSFDTKKASMGYYNYSENGFSLNLYIRFLVVYINYQEKRFY
jgi:hypothetical protein